jgi:hypothetical protein
MKRRAFTLPPVSPPRPERPDPHRDLAVACAELLVLAVLAVRAQRHADAWWLLLRRRAVAAVLHELRTDGAA